ncbi:AfsR/SARP family transcriptional regulator [Pengzhenrongella frigida]|uniref:SARP family transcriptional regulator n=1 Tax=Pengzhenrongella frigida TaxID=1259133 RepID=A0A4V1ZHK0_9MICO|nr:BTAD domain-containing putative transcriptional regulator [Cellulomonas sp. HLT2-17]RYV52314.1 SARP family transcriptional regulator [Cellulomonas sp. HLT2-17]
MVARINLLGPPSIERAGAPVAPPRGSKAWALLAYLALTDGPVPRSRLMDLLFDEADDPAAALRWSLSQLRRALAGVADVGGDPLRYEPHAGTVVDVDVLAHGSWVEALMLPGFGGGLLEGVTPRVGAAFDLWLSTERRRTAGQRAAILQEAAHSRLARGDVASAVDLAGRLVAAEPLTERSLELLVRALVAGGDHAAAVERVRDCRALFLRELGTAPSSALDEALRRRPASGTTRTAAAVDAAIEGGVGAAHVGAYERAVELLRSAVDGSRALEDGPLLARSLGELGGTLVRGVRGSDEEAVGVLHEASAMARDLGARGVAAKAALELGHVELLRAHYPRMEVWFDRATALADDDAHLLAWVGVYAGLGRTDQADYPRAARTLDRAVERARSVGDQRALAYALTGLGRLRLLRAELDAARSALDLACATADELGWTAFLPFPRALRAEVAMARGDLDGAAEAFDRSYALACQVGDPCWESYSLRGRGLLAATVHDDALALDLLLEAPAACRRQRVTHNWVEGHCLDALCRFAVSRGLAGAPGWVDELDEFASRRGMRELVARAAVHRCDQGQDGARELAAVLVAGIDNPALAGEVTSRA